MDITKTDILKMDMIKMVKKNRNFIFIWEPL